MTEASRYLRALAERVAAACVEQTRPRAILLTGSVAQGESDYHSDIDLITYHDALPSDEQLRTMHGRIGIDAAAPLGGSRDSGAFSEDLDIGGVQCQVLYSTIGKWEEDLADVLERFDTRSLTQKAIEGLLRGVPLHGADLIERWQARALDYPPGLARAMVEANLHVYPIWSIQDWFAARESTLWYYQTLVESSYNILGTLAGLNGLYFVPFQPKRIHRFVGKMHIAPDNLAARLDGLFAAEYADAMAELERLVGETVALVGLHMPEVDTSRVRQHLGARRPQWAPDPTWLPPGAM